MNPSSIIPISSFCQLAEPVAKSTAGMIWSVITFLWPWYWLAIVIGLVLWIVLEIITRNGAVHYNSENGFSSSFNRFVGSGSNLLIQSILVLVLDKIFGDVVYCNPLSYILHTLAFILTGISLCLTGFWVYLKLPSGEKIRWR